MFASIARNYLLEAATQGRPPMGAGTERQGGGGHGGPAAVNVAVTPITAAPLDKKRKAAFAPDPPSATLPTKTVSLHTAAHAAGVAVPDDFAPEPGRLREVVLNAILTQPIPFPPGAQPPKPTKNRAPPPPHPSRAATQSDLTDLVTRAAVDAVRTVLNEWRAEHISDGQLAPTLGPTAAPGTFQHALDAYRAAAALGASSLVSDKVQSWSRATWGTDVVQARRRLNDVAVAMFTSGRAPTTWDARRSALRTYTYFAHTFHYDPFPADENTMISFAVWSATRITVGSVKKYIGHVRAAHTERGIAMPTNEAMPRLMQILDGFERAQAAAKGGVTRLPLTFGLLTKLIWDKRTAHAALATEPSIYSLSSQSMAEAVYTLALVAATRPSEIAVRNTSAGWSAPLRLKHYVDNHQLDHAVLKLPKRKNQQLGERCDIAIGSTHHWVCARTFMRTYLNNRLAAGEELNGESLLFPIRGKSGAIRPMAYHDLTKALEIDLERSGFDPKEYTGHSFRIGAATTMAINGVPTIWLEDLGGWARGSKALQSYVHLNLAPAQQRADMATFLSRSYVSAMDVVRGIKPSAAAYKM